MSNEKRFVVKNGLQTGNIKFVSPDRDSSILAEMLDTATLGFTGSVGEILTIIDTQEGVLFSVNGANSEPLIEVESISEVRLVETEGRVLVGKSDTIDFDTKLQVDGGILTDDITITGALSANGSIGTSGQTLRSDGTKTFWSTEVGFTGSQGTTGFTGSRGDFASISNDTSTNATRYVTFVSSTSGTASSVNVSSSKLQFNPSTGTLSATELNSLSDARLKTNLVSIENPLEILNQIDGFKFQWKDTQKKSFGVLAQEIEKILPEIVAESDYKTVNYNAIIAILIEAIKELNRKIEK